MCISAVQAPCAIAASRKLPSRSAVPAPYARWSKRIDTNVDFRCLHCGSQVLADARLSGVNNRNHCPYCLYSRHVDWKEAGDRLSPCKGPMRAVGLTLKRVKKKYGPQLGEVMLIHRCETCGQLSYNRIAADDDLEKLNGLLASANKQDSDLPELDDQALELIRQGLFGRNG